MTAEVPVTTGRIRIHVCEAAYNHPGLAGKTPISEGA
jgi:hypothetical protein